MRNNSSLKVQINKGEIICSQIEIDEKCLWIFDYLERFMLQNCKNSDDSDIISIMWRNRSEGFSVILPVYNNIIYTSYNLYTGQISDRSWKLDHILTIRQLINCNS